MRYCLIRLWEDNVATEGLLLAGGQKWPFLSKLIFPAEVYRSQMRLCRNYWSSWVVCASEPVNWLGEGYKTAGSWTGCCLPHMSQHWCMLEGGSSSLLSCLHNSTRKMKVCLHDVKVYCYLNESWPALWVYPKSSSNSPRVKELHDSWGVRNSGPLFGLWSSVHNRRGHCSCFGRMHLIICENKACLWSSDPPGDRNTLFVACWTHQVYPLLNNAVLLYLATVHSMPSVCWAWGDLGGDSARASLSRAEVYME